MRSITRQDFDAMDVKAERNRLETPMMVGFRAGMSSCSVIGRKLGSLYSVPNDCPDRISTLIKAIDRTVRSR